MADRPQVSLGRGDYSLYTRRQPGIQPTPRPGDDAQKAKKDSAIEHLKALPINLNLQPPVTKVFSKLEPVWQPATTKPRLQPTKLASTATMSDIIVVKPEPVAKPAISRPQSSQVLRREFKEPIKPVQPEPKTVEQEPLLSSMNLVLDKPVKTKQRFNKPKLNLPRPVKPQLSFSKTQLVFIGIAGFIFFLGIAASLQVFKTNKNATAQIANITQAANKLTSSSQSTNNKTNSNPTTEPLSLNDVNQYKVGPNLARYLQIPKLGIYARVMQTGTKVDGISAPSNIFDSYWYSSSAKPGQPGATLIDGYASAGTTNGVFSNIKTLVPGDQLQIITGSGKTINYQVVSSETITVPANMQAATTPVTAGKSGLNLMVISTGSMTSAPNEVLVVFATQD